MKTPKTKTKKPLSKEQIKQSEKISELIAQIGQSNITISNLRVTITKLGKEIINLKAYKQFKTDLTKFVQEH